MIIDWASDINSYFSLESMSNVSIGYVTFNWSGSLVVKTLTSKGRVTKLLDSSNVLIIEHNLAAEPDIVIITPKSGNEANWRVISKDDRYVTIGASVESGTAGSSADVVCLILHSIIS